MNLLLTVPLVDGEDGGVRWCSACGAYDVRVPRCTLWAYERERETERKVEGELTASGGTGSPLLRLNLTTFVYNVRYVVSCLWYNSYAQSGRDLTSSSSTILRGLISDWRKKRFFHLNGWNFRLWFLLTSLELIGRVLIKFSQMEMVGLLGSWTSEKVVAVKWVQPEIPGRNKPALELSLLHVFP